jgi:6-pyruvoyltetrahydropterin/6-carboxytetrahydropterin synthase
MHKLKQTGMARIRITREFGFEMAHALWNYDGACRNIHGHSYKLFVTLSGEPVTDSGNPKFGMVMDFGDLKKLVKESVVDHLDHSLVVYREAGGENLDAVKKMYSRVHVFEFQPTCENLVFHIAEKIREMLPYRIILHSVRLYETATSYAEWFAGDNNGEG